jgi:hypothetical protein
MFFAFRMIGRSIEPDADMLRPHCEAGKTDQLSRNLRSRNVSTTHPGGESYFPVASRSGSRLAAGAIDKIRSKSIDRLRLIPSGISQQLPCKPYAIPEDTVGVG